MDKKVILFIDDLDRCSEIKYSNIDSLRVITENKYNSSKTYNNAPDDEIILRRVIYNK